jgi:hypothetical protein
LAQSTKILHPILQPKIEHSPAAKKKQLKLCVARLKIQPILLVQPSKTCGPNIKIIKKKAPQKALPSGPK